MVPWLLHNPSLYHSKKSVRNVSNIKIGNKMQCIDYLKQNGISLMLIVKKI